MVASAKVLALIHVIHNATVPDLEMVSYTFQSSCVSSEVLFLWEPINGEIALYCVPEANSQMIVFKDVYDGQERNASVTLEEASQYTCYLSAKNENGIGRSSNQSLSTSELHTM